MYLFELLYQYLEENYFSASLGKNYDYLDFTGMSTTLLVIVGGLCLGIIIASIAIVLQKKHVGQFIRALLSADAHTKESAKTLKELGLSKSAIVKHALSYASVARKLVTVVDGEEVFTYKDELSNLIRKKESAESEGVASDEGESGECAKENEPTDSAQTALEGEKKNALAGFFSRGNLRLRRLDFKTVRFFIPRELSYRASLRYNDKGSSWLGVLVAVIVSVALFLLALRFIPLLVGLLDASIANLLG